MAPSYREIDYRIRPAKHVERLMLCEAFRHLRFHVLNDYQYVGLGSIFFTDFRLVHRSLGISRMISIEKVVNHRDRFEWNKPYAGISLRFGTTGQHLSRIDFNIPTIFWLDYDDPLSGSIISDIRTVAHNASHGSVLVVTVNAHPRKPDENGSDMLEQIRAELGSNRIPPDVTLESLRGRGLAKLYRKVADAEVRDALSAANGVRRSEDERDYEQLFNFHYEDDARMATFGGVFFERRKHEEFQACAFERLSFVRNNATSFHIPTPKLTSREVAHLERQLPLSEGSNLEYEPMPKRDAMQYKELYRYLPTFLPVELL